MNAPRPQSGRLVAKLRRIRALIGKEGRQVMRDPSSFAIGVILPLMLILLFGYGMSLDVRHTPIGVLRQDPARDAREIEASFRLSPYFRTRSIGSMA